MDDWLGAIPEPDRPRAVPLGMVTAAALAAPIVCMTLGVFHVIEGPFQNWTRRRADILGTDRTSALRALVGAADEPGAAASAP